MKIIKYSSFIILLISIQSIGMRYNAEATSKLKSIPIYDTLSWRSTSEVENLLQQGADPNIVAWDRTQKTWLDEAAAYDSFSSLVERLLKSGADFNRKNDGVTPLYRTFVNGAIKNASLLLQAGASTATMRNETVRPALTATLMSAYTAKLSYQYLPRKYFEVIEILLKNENETISPADGLITHPHTNAELTYRLRLNELEILFRKKAAQPLYQIIKNLKRERHAGYLSRLPEEVLQEIEFFVTDHIYEDERTSKTAQIKANEPKEVTGLIPGIDI